MSISPAVISYRSVDQIRQTERPECRYRNRPRQPCADPAVRLAEGMCLTTLQKGCRV
jgi:hypothetical protein